MVASGTDRERCLRRGQALAAALLALAIGGGLARDVLWSPAVPFLSHRDAPWIVAQTPLQTHGMEIDRAHPPTSFFARPFSAERSGAPVRLYVRALREVELFLNDRALPLEPADWSRWKRVRSLDLTPHLAAGENVISARVRNPDGNPALQLWIDGLAERVETDERWLAAWEGDPVAHAARAEDGTRHPEAGALPAPAASLARHAGPLALLAALGALAFLGLRRLPPRLAQRAPALARVLAALFWALVFCRALAFPAEVGFDAAAHLAYIDWIGEHRALPEPGQGGSIAYHPPLYHAGSALLRRLLGPLGVGDHATALLLPVASGLGMAFVAGAMARALAPGAAWLEAGAVLAAAVLPMSATIASTASNEAPHALLASLALLAALRALLRARASHRDDALLGAALGAAALTKYTGLLWLPILTGAVAVKRLGVERTSIARAARGLALTAGIALALAGWVYLRNLLASGDALVWNLNADPGKSWWQLPGFHTAGYFLRFGDALSRPWFSSFYSFWDSVYTTLWGDGLLSGATDPGHAIRRWRYEAMAAGYLLALPATLLVAAGWLVAARAACRGQDLGRRLALSLLVLLPPLFLAALASLALRYPFWSAPKAFYALALGPTLALLGAFGFAALDSALAARAPLALRALPYGWASAFLATAAWSFAA